MATASVLAVGAPLWMAAPAYALPGNTIAVTDSADPVTAGTSYTYHITGTAPDFDDVADQAYFGVRLILSGAEATITAVVSSPDTPFCTVVASTAQCYYDGEPFASAYTMDVTVTPNTAGTVQAHTELYNHTRGELVTATADTDTTINPAADPAFPFTGFFSPVDNLPTVNSMSAGGAVPVKFSLGGDEGLNIFNPSYPASQQINCQTGDPIDSIEETVTAGNSSLQYNQNTGQYTYIWKTDNAWEDTCRQLTLQLTDGTNHQANFEFN